MHASVALLPYALLILSYGTHATVQVYAEHHPQASGVQSILGSISTTTQESSQIVPRKAQPADSDPDSDSGPGSSLETIPLTSVFRDSPGRSAANRAFGRAWGAAEETRRTIKLVASYREELLKLQRLVIYACQKMLEDGEKASPVLSETDRLSAQGAIDVIMDSLGISEQWRDAVIADSEQVKTELTNAVEAWTRGFPVIVERVSGWERSSCGLRQTAENFC